MWQVRENVPVSLMQLSRQRFQLNVPIDCNINHQSKENHVSIVKIGKLYKYDVSLSLNDTNEFIFELKDNLVERGYDIHGFSKAPFKNSNCILEFCNFGHAADQNLHLNILAFFKTVNYEDSVYINEKDIQEHIVKLHAVLNELVYELIIKKRGISFNTN